jgi:endonuclease/exonuclease/phosphatase family metal-dependent hydrolase
MTLQMVALVAATIASGACASARGSADPTVRVLVYNIHAGTDTERRSNLERVGQVIRDSRADIVLLQEVDRRTRRSRGVDQLDSLQRLTGLSTAFGKAIDYDGGEYGLGVLSRWAILADSVFPLPVEAPHAGYEARVALVAHIAFPPERLRVVNTHLDASRQVYRNQQTTALGRVAAGPPAASLIGGDLNSEPEQGVVTMLSSFGFNDLYPRCGAGSGLTFPVANPVKRIDYLLASSRWRCVSASVLPADASDHRAVLFEIIRR